MRSSITSVARIDDVNLSWVVDGKEYNINITFPVCYPPPPSLLTEGADESSQPRGQNPWPGPFAV